MSRGRESDGWYPVRSAPSTDLQAAWLRSTGEKVIDAYTVIADLRATGVAVLLVEQNARAALQVSDYGYVLETGEVALEGASDALMDDPKVIEAYLGLGGQR